MTAVQQIRVARVGVVGAGDISGRYIEAMRGTGLLNPVAIASAGGRSAERQARVFDLEALSVETLLKHQKVDLVLNLAPPLAHGSVTRRALLSGKHVYSEKPLAGSLKEARQLADRAALGGLLLASAPATFLGPALQTARSLIDSGEIGEVVGARASMIYPGPDLWHHNPDHLFGPLAGPLFDMGVYHVGAIVALLGPISQVQAIGSRRASERQIKSGPRAGECFPVSVPTHLCANLGLASGAIASAIFSFDGFGSKGPGLEIIGTKGTIAIERPSQFDGAVQISRTLSQWQEVPASIRGWCDSMWAVGPAEAWAAHQRGAIPRTSAGFACHIVEVLAATEAAAASGQRIQIESSAERPSPLTCDYGAVFSATEIN
jgi:predicted dehydrogenase